MLGVVDSHSLDIALVHTAVTGLGPSSLVSLFTTKLEDSDATIHATGEDGSAICAANKIETVRIVAVYALRESVRSSVPELKLAVGVTRDDVTIG